MNSRSNADHLVVLTHGVLGTADDLLYLGNLLKDSGFPVLRSVANESFKSLRGVEKGGSDLAEEIIQYISENTNVRRISIAAHSLGGLYARYAVKLLYNDSNGAIAGLVPCRFVSIATPHLGVSDWTFIDDYGYKAPDVIKTAASMFMCSTGKDIFRIKDEDCSEEEILLFRMATEESFLTPLRSFSERRLYANLRRDFVVPLGTAAFMDNALVQNLRDEHSEKSGIVSVIRIPCNVNNGAYGSFSHTDQMIAGLNDLGWEKIIVHFPGLIPLAHNQICALNKYPKWLFDDILGFNAGEFVMMDAKNWLTKDIDTV